MFQNNPPIAKTMPLSLGIERAIIESLKAEDSATEQGITEQLLVHNIAKAFKLAHPPALVDKHLSILTEKVINRINTLKVEEEGKPSQSISIHIGKSLGTRYSEWLSELNSEQVCLYLTDYDLAKAEHIYWYAELTTVHQALKMKAHHDSQLALIQMEACLYGAGGKYEDDEGGGNHHNLDTDEGLAALKSLGF